MKLALTVRYGYDEQLLFAQQLGADAVVMSVDIGDPADTDLDPVAYRASVAGMPLAAVELAHLPRDFDVWSNAVSGAILSAEGAGVRLLLCDSPTRDSKRLAAALEAVVAVATATDVTICLDTADLLPAETALLPAGDVHLELAVGLPPYANSRDLPQRLAERAQAGGVGFVRFEGGGRLLSDGDLDVPACLAALAGAGYAGHVRAGTPPLLAEDDDWHPKGAAADLGYLRAALQALDASAG